MKEKPSDGQRRSWGTSEEERGLRSDKVPSVRIGRRAWVSVQDGCFKVRRGAHKKAVLGLLFRNFTKKEVQGNEESC